MVARDYILVGLGSFLGGMCRYGCGGFLLHHFPNSRLPLATLIVNIAGCFCIGLLAGLGERYQLLSPELKLLLITGILGGFTTFSAFGFETMFLLRRGEATIAALYVLLSVAGGLAAVGIGNLSVLRA